METPDRFYFPAWANKVATLLAGVATIGGLYVVGIVNYGASPKTISAGYQPEQIVPFSHKLHAGELKMDCRYCHNTVEKAAHAAIPPTATCGNCHGGNATTKGERDLGQIHKASENLTAVRESLETGDPVEWIRVHDLPDFVYFNHSVHVNKGVSCVSCHGRIDQMDVVTQVETLSMKWCLDCHRNPEPNIRDPELVTQLDLVIDDPEANGKEWAEKLNVDPKVNCSTCHR